jgi:hypothetical protein
MAGVSGCGGVCPDGIYRRGGECVSFQDTGSGEEYRGLCPEYSGIQGLGTRWEYEYYDEHSETPRIGTYTPEVIAFDEDSGEVTISGDEVYEDVGYSFAGTRRYEYLCDEEGLWERAEYFEGVYSRDSEDEYYYQEGIWEQPAFLLPTKIGHRVRIRLAES